MPGGGPALSSSSSSSSSSLVPRSSSATANRPVVTQPPWARDEPRSSTDSVHIVPSTPTSASRPASRSDVLSLASDARPDREHRWFPFTRRSALSPSPSRPSVPPPTSVPSSSSSSHPREPTPPPPPSLSEPARAVTASSLSSTSTPIPDAQAHAHSRFRSWGLHVSLPPPPQSAQAAQAATTLAQSRTPGWESPWVPKIPHPFPLGGHHHHHHAHGGLGGPLSDEKQQERARGRWRYFKKRARRYLLTNVYAPLLFRFINITLTTSALALAAQLRRIEKHETLRGSLGPSPTLVVVFSPLTLAHVMVAIYLEYFGRPLGLWRTSAKLAHTLVEVIFICLWSGALALCLNDFFVYFTPCSSLVLESNDTPGALADGDEVPCNHQVALVCLVAVGLLMYCLNLVISLFRIFEKVKVHNHTLVKGVHP